jgi:hypothetical protein
LNKLPKVDIVSSGLSVLQPHDERYANAVILKISDTVQMSPEDFWHKLLQDDAGRYDSEAVALLSLALGARDSAQLARGSNPIWYRRLQEGENGYGESLQAASKVWARSISGDISASPSIARQGTRVINADLTKLSLAKTFDFCLTSPPYLNRLDYVIAHLPELTVLKHVARVDIDRLRAAMIGTTKIILKDDTPIPDVWGKSCRATLEKIWNHKSYASRSYYYHTHRQYFSGLYTSLEKVTKLLRPNGRGIVVLQNSFYKDVDIPTPYIATEMIQSLSWNAQIITTEPIKAHMGRMSHKQEEYVPQKTLNESSIYLFR